MGERKGKLEGKQAHEFLEYIDDEAFAQLAMCADIRDETIVFLRYGGTY